MSESPIKWSAIQERLADDSNISGYIQAKYVEGRWLSDEDRGKFVWTIKDGVGRAF